MTAKKAEVRGTQSFVYVMAAVWRQPSLVALEVLWRWAFGVVALWLLGTYGWRVWLTATDGSGDPARVQLGHFNLTDPMVASERVAYAMSQIIPPALHIALWLAPALLAGWVVVSAIGRTAVLRSCTKGALRVVWRSGMPARSRSMSARR